MLIRVVFFLGFLCLSLLRGDFANAITLPQNDPSPGGIAVIRVEKTPISFLFGRRQLMTLQSGQQQWALVGLSLGIAPGQYIISSGGPGKTGSTTAFTVIPHRFGYFETAGTDASSSLAPVAGAANPKVLQIALSLPRSKVVSNRPLFPFQTPVGGSAILPFGTWLYNRANTGYQTSGIQYRADTPRVSSPGDGVIQATIIREDGMAVIIDHGQGLISILYPLEPIAIKPLQRVRRGQVLGRTRKGKSGFSHLTWMTLLNRNWVNPTLLLLPK